MTDKQTYHVLTQAALDDIANAADQLNSMSGQQLRGQGDRVRDLSQLIQTKIEQAVPIDEDILLGCPGEQTEQTSKATSAGPARERAPDSRTKLRAVIETGIEAAVEILDMSEELCSSAGADDLTGALEPLSMWAGWASEQLNAEQEEPAALSSQRRPWTSRMDTVYAELKAKNEKQRAPHPTTPVTNITEYHKQVFHALTHNEPGYALFSCFYDGESTAAIVRVTRDIEGTYHIAPRLVFLTEDMMENLASHDGEVPSV